MKKLLLLSGILIAGMAVYAQNNRLVLYEEFTGENCPPCASTNPQLEALFNSGNNESKILLITYHVPIPRPGPITAQNPSVPQNRGAYYGVNFAPWGNMDGGLPPGLPATQPKPNNVGYVVQLGQSSIDKAAAVPTPFTIKIPSYMIKDGKLNATIQVTSDKATSGKLVLRVALVETLDFKIPPGTTTETHFPNVVREMYPGPNGQPIAVSWTANQKESYTISGTIPSFVDTANEHMLVVWIQDDADKNVKQAAIAKDYKTSSINSVVLNSNSLQINPNPVKDYMNVSLEMEESANVTFDVTNISGQIMKGTEKKLNKGNNKVELSTSSLAPGFYFLNISNGSKSIQRKFVKK